MRKLSADAEIEDQRNPGAEVQPIGELPAGDPQRLAQDERKGQREQRAAFGEEFDPDVLVLGIDGQVCVELVDTTTEFPVELREDVVVIRARTDTEPRMLPPYGKPHLADQHAIGARRRLVGEVEVGGESGDLLRTAERRGVLDVRRRRNQQRYDRDRQQEPQVALHEHAAIEQHQQASEPEEQHPTGLRGRLDEHEHEQRQQDRGAPAQLALDKHDRQQQEREDVEEMRPAGNPVDPVNVEVRLRLEEDPVKAVNGDELQRCASREQREAPRDACPNLVAREGVRLQERIDGRDREQVEGEPQRPFDRVERIGGRGHGNRQRQQRQPGVAWYAGQRRLHVSIHRCRRDQPHRQDQKVRVFDLVARDRDEEQIGRQQEQRGRQQCCG